MSLGDKYFWRQSLVLIADSLHSVGTGFMLSFSSAVNPALLSNSTDIKATSNEVSWISASLGLAGLIGFFIIPPIFQYFGRKFVHIAINVLVAIGFLILYLARNVTTLFVGKFFQGLSTSGVTLTVIIIAEYSHPKRRGYFMNIKKASLSLGSLICHSLYVTWSWKEIALVAIIPYILSTILTFFWPESPYYLAMKGRFEDCKQSHKWLFGDAEKSNKELEELIVAQTERRKRPKRNAIALLRRILGKFGRKDFMKPFACVVVLTLIIESSGRYYMMLYVIQIVQEITGNKSVAVYCSIATDILTIIALIVSSCVVRIMSRRGILIKFGFATAAFMYLLSIVIHLKLKYKIGENLLWLTPSLIAVNTFLTNVGILPVAYTVIGEIYPLEHKGMGSLLAGVIFVMFYSLTAKLIPTMIAKTGVEGMFAIFASCILICVLVLHYILVETKDRTLQSIENEIKDVKRVDIRIHETPAPNDESLELLRNKT